MNAPAITNWWAVKREALTRLGEAEFDRRVAVARAKAREVADDRTLFAEDEDRESVFRFMAGRLTTLAVRLTDFAKFEATDHETLWCVVVEMETNGITGS